MKRIIKALTQDVDRSLARRNADGVARLLGSKIVHKERIVIGEPFYPFHIPIHTKGFRCTVSVSDSAYAFNARHRRDTAAVPEKSTFCVSVKSPLDYMFCRKCLGAISKTLGLRVYAQPWGEVNVIAAVLLSEPVLEALHKIDFGPLSGILLSPVQLQATSKFFASAQVCAEQSRALRHLITTFFDVASAR